MDKELPKSKLGNKPPKSYIRVYKSNLPGVKAYTASVLYRPTLDIEAIAQRIAEKRSEFRKETFVTTFNIIKEEIYDAIEDGFNVDFGFGRTEMSVSGAFDYLNQKADRERHKLVPNLRPSPRLRQHAARIPLETEIDGPSTNAPRPSYVSLRMEPRTSESTEPFNSLPAGKHPFLNISRCRRHAAFTRHGRKLLHCTQRLGYQQPHPSGICHRPYRLHTGRVGSRCRQPVHPDLSPLQAGAVRIPLLLGGVTLPLAGDSLPAT